MRQPYVVPRHRLAIAVWFTVLALPILVLDNIPRTDARADQARVAAVAPPTTSPATTVAPTSTTEAPTTTAPPDTTVPATSAPPTTARATTTVKPKPPAPPPTTANPAPTAAPAPPPTAAPSGRSEEGQATFYDYRPGECAHKTLPKGTVVSVTNLANGASVSCVVTDRGPFGPGRIIDLDRSDFARIADVSSGVISVRITW